MSQIPRPLVVPSATRLCQIDDPPVRGTWVNTQFFNGLPLKDVLLSTRRFDAIGDGRTVIVSDLGPRLPFYKKHKIFTRQPAGIRASANSPSADARAKLLSRLSARSAARAPCQRHRIGLLDVHAPRCDADQVDRAGDFGSSRTRNRRGLSSQRVTLMFCAVNHAARRVTIDLRAL